MLIKFKKPDPRAGMVANMDSSLGQKMVDQGRADVHKDPAADEAATAAPAKPVAAPVAPLVTKPAAKRGRA